RVMVAVKEVVVFLVLPKTWTVPPLMFKLPVAAPELADWLAIVKPPAPIINAPFVPMAGVVPTVSVPLASAKVVDPLETAMLTFVASTTPVSNERVPLPALFTLGFELD